MVSRPEGAAWMRERPRRTRDVAGPSSLILGSARLNSLQLWPRVDQVFSVLPQHPVGALFLPDGLIAGYLLPGLGLLLTCAAWETPTSERFLLVLHTGAALSPSSSS